VYRNGARRRPPRVRIAPRQTGAAGVMVSISVSVPVVPLLGAVQAHAQVRHAEEDADLVAQPLHPVHGLVERA
jgi:hypothetical protein